MTENPKLELPDAEDEAKRQAAHRAKKAELLKVFTDAERFSPPLITNITTR